MVMPNLPDLEIELIKSNFDKIKDKFDKNDNLKIELLRYITLVNNYKLVI